MKDIFDSIDIDNKELSNDLAILPSFHTKFQVENFILLKDCVSEYGLFRNSKKELQHRLDLLVNYKFDYQKMQIEKLQLEIKVKDCQDDLDKQLLEIELERKKYSLSKIESVIKDVYTEYKVIKSYFTLLYNAFKDKDLEPFETDYWVKVYSNQYLESKMSGSPNPEAALSGLNKPFYDLVKKTVNLIGATNEK